MLGPEGAEWRDGSRVYRLGDGSQAPERRDWGAPHGPHGPAPSDTLSQEVVLVSPGAGRERRANNTSFP